MYGAAAILDTQSKLGMVTILSFLSVSDFSAFLQITDVDKQVLC